MVPYSRSALPDGGGGVGGGVYPRCVALYLML